jgi:hypothetical protein
MNQNILQYYILGGTIWRRRRRARAAAARAEETKRKAESVALLRDAVRGGPATASQRGILAESDAALPETPRRPST